MLGISIADEARLVRYMFGLHTAEYLLCRDCGVYVAAVTTGDSERRAIAQLNALIEDQDFGVAVAVDYDDESRVERIKRRSQVWMPVSVNNL